MPLPPLRLRRLASKVTFRQTIRLPPETDCVITLPYGPIPCLFSFSTPIRRVLVPSPLCGTVPALTSQEPPIPFAFAKTPRLTSARHRKWSILARFFDQLSFINRSLPLPGIELIYPSERIGRSPDLWPPPFRVRKKIPLLTPLFILIFSPQHCFFPR